MYTTYLIVVTRTDNTAKLIHYWGTWEGMRARMEEERNKPNVASVKLWMPF